MRIPVSHSDLEAKRFSKLAKTLRKCWAVEALSSMQAQNLMATLLGYRDLYDLQSNLVPEIRLDYRAKSPFSRTEVHSSIAWVISRRHSISYGAALALVESLPLKIMDFDKLTGERKTETFLAAQRRAGELIIMDEAGFYMGGPQWCEETPMLLEAGAPPYKFVILPSGQAIRWSNILARIERLPADLATRLRAEPGYRDATSDREALVSFYRKEILPEVEERAPDAILADRELAPGFEVQAYSERSLVLYNKSLGGLIPIAYDAHSMKIFEDMATIMTAGVIRHDITGFTPDSRDRMWFEGHGSSPEPVAKPWPMARFLESSFSVATPGIARTFVERGHEYARCQLWLDETHLPASVQGWVNLPPRPEIESTEAIPRWHRDFHYQVMSAIKMRAIHSQRQLSRASKDGRLVDLILRLAGDPGEFESRTLEQIEEWHPSEPDHDPFYEESQETLDYYREEHEEALAHYRQEGASIAEAFPVLASLGITTLGWLYYQHHDLTFDCLEARYIDLFDRRKDDVVSGFLTYLVYHYAVTRAGAEVYKGSAQGLSKALQIMVCQLLEGECTQQRMPGEYMCLARFSEKLRAQETQIQNIVEWRCMMDANAKASQGSEWLYASEKVDEVRPPSVAEMLMEGRKYGGYAITASQDLADMQPSSLVSLFAQARSVNFSADDISTNIDRKN